MHLAHLSLTNFRNYLRLELPLTPGITIITGDNAQGKSNLLEAILFLATTKSFRTGTDHELINWLAGAEQPFARIAARLNRAQSQLRIEIAIQEQARTSVETTLPATSKLVRVNGLPKRAIDLIGEANVVMFSPQDVALVTGAPHYRRRYIDVTISQVDPRYVRALALYNRVLARRNHLLRQVRERQAAPDQLFFWDGELVNAGAYLLSRRLETVAALNRLVREVHRRLTASKERLQICYRSTMGHEVEASGAFDAAALESRVEAITGAFRNLLHRNQAREIAAGASLFGPHRDDLTFLLEERDAAVYGSRGQQRTVALSLKIAEAALMRERTGEEPIVLLDDIMSELDHHRADRVLEILGGLQQVLVTAIDLRAFDADLLARSTVFRVEEGTLTRLDPDAIRSAAEM